MRWTRQAACRGAEKCVQDFWPENPRTLGNGRQVQRVEWYQNGSQRNRM